MTDHVGLEREVVIYWYQWSHQHLP